MRALAAVILPSPPFRAHMNSILADHYPSLLQRSHRLLAAYPGHPLQPEDLLHMAIERLLRNPPASELRPSGFFGLVVLIMQRALVDEWRRLHSLRRAAAMVPLGEALEVPAPDAEPWPDLTEALCGLRRELPEAADVVEHRFFLGIPQCDLARRLDLSPATVSRRWHQAADFLRSALRHAAA